VVAPGPEFDLPPGALLPPGIITLSREAGPDDLDAPAFPERPESFTLVEGDPNLVQPPRLPDAGSALRSAFRSPFPGPPTPRDSFPASRSGPG
jgi:hypothetical protein